MRLVRKLLTSLLLLLFLLCAAGAALLTYLAYARQPMLDGALAHPTLRGEVRVLRDDWGVPHISAEHETDAYFALGYVMGQDRLFQMELARRLAGGTLAEVFGQKAVAVDSVVRALRLRPKAAETYAWMQDAYPHLIALLEAFAAGINARIESEALPFEFAVLLHTPAPFTPVDCLSVGALLPITFADGIRSDPLASMIQQRHPELDITTLFPGYSREVPVTVMESFEEAERIMRESLPGNTAPLSQDLTPLRDWLGLLRPFTEHFGPALGSNSWVLAGSRTRSGKPILANDPHIGFTNPGIWYEAHLVYGDFESYGYHLPLIPFPLISHNRDRAWALTMFANDDVDLYLETFDPNDSRQVRYRNAWAAVEVEEEWIQVRFGKPVRAQVRITPHGPVITDLLRAIAAYEGPDVALSWTWQHTPYTDLEAFYRMGHARNYDDFAEGVALITSPGLNISYAAADGDIAWWAAGLIPVRPPHVNSKLLLDGASGRDEITGYVPREQNPHLRNPDWGYIVTANNLSTVHPVGELPLLEGYWQPSDRAARIKALLEPQHDWSLDALREVQTDATAHAAPEMVRHISLLLEPAVPNLGEHELAALNLLKNWDGHHGADSAAAAVYQVLTDFILLHAVVDELGQDLFAVYGGLGDHWNFFKFLLRSPDLPLWNRIDTDTVETAEEIVLDALHDTVRWLRAQCGPKSADWTWGKLHTLEFKHPFGYLPGPSLLFNIGPFPVPGGDQMVNNLLFHKGQLDFRVIAGPSTRRIIDFGDIEHSLSVLPTGNSGNFMSPHYADQAGMFVAGAYRSVRFTPAQVLENARHRLDFRPE